MTTFKYAQLPVTEVSPDMRRRLVHTDHIMLVIVDLDGPSTAVPLHQHPHEQISYIVEGEVNFVIGDGAERAVDRVGPGDAVVVPPDAPHTVEVLTESARVIDCFYPIREDFL
ncbi:MAG: cupin domain-containing protein [Anaerolineae bacterium]|nr:cupin domain-containing protein [Anaerolineae bacterium]